ncbi:hypothetical protein [Corynebacterium kroppenstedtii]
MSITINRRTTEELHKRRKAIYNSFKDAGILRERCPADTTRSPRARRHGDTIRPRTTPLRRTRKDREPTQLMNIDELEEASEVFLNPKVF